MNVIVYGTGLLAKECIEKLIIDNSIVCILDRVRLNGKFYGIPIRSWEDVYQGEAEAIYIAAPEKYYKEIYFRILPYAAARKIKIYSYSGQNLGDVFGISAPPISKKSKKQLIDLIDKNDVVSFDIFDTLLMRKVLKSIDVFKLVEIIARNENIIIKDFYKIRRESELENIDRTIYEIYETLADKCKLTKEKVNRLIEIEIECEKKMLTTRKEIVKCLKYCRSVGKRVILVSDMYYTKEILRDILSENNIKEFDDIYISCEFGMSKSNGLLKYVKNIYKEKRCLHIGDDISADIVAGEFAGWNVFHINKAYDIAIKSPLYRCIGHVTSLYESIVLGNFMANTYNNPFLYDNEITSLRLWAETFYVPIIVEYINLLKRALEERQYDGILFAARDGYLFNDIYSKLRKNKIINGPESIYILSSRRLSIGMGVQTQEDIRVINSFYGIKDKTAEFYHFWEIEENCIESEEKIIENSALRREKYKKYLLSKGIDFSKKYLYCELDGHGTGCYFLSRLFVENLDSLYLIRQHTQPEYDSNMKIYAAYRWKKGDYRPFLYYTKELETVFTSHEQSICGFDNNINPVFEKEGRSYEQINDLKKIQSIIESTYFKINETIGSENLNLSDRFLENLFEAMSEFSMTSECHNLQNTFFCDELMN